MDALEPDARRCGGRGGQLGAGRDNCGFEGNGMPHSTLSDVATHIREQAAAYCESSKVPGYLAGVYHDGDQAVVAHGIANVVTGAPMREDTGFLLSLIHI